MLNWFSIVFDSYRNMGCVTVQQGYPFSKRIFDRLFDELGGDVQKIAQNFRSSINPNLSRQLFDEALDLKRNGNFKKSIQKYKESIRAYPDDSELNGVFYALGKVLYLDYQFEDSFKAYQCYFYFSIVPPMLADFKSALGNLTHDDRVDTLFRGIINNIDTQLAGQPIAQLVSFFSNPCVHFGHSLLDSTEGRSAPEVISAYRLSMIGKNTPDREWRYSPYSFKLYVSWSFSSV